MALVNKTIKIDLWQKMLERITVVQREILGRSLTFQLYSGALPVNLSGCSVTFYAEKQDGTIVFNACTIVTAASGICVYTFTEQTIIVAGNLTCQLVIVGASADKLRTQEFTVEVQASSDYTSSVESTSEFTALDVALALVSDHEGRLAAAEGDIDDLTTQNADVTKYGADKTGVENSTAAFIAAVNAIKSAEYTEDVPTARVTRQLYIPGGIYKITAKISVPSYIHIKGDGRHITFLDSYITNGDPVLEIVEPAGNLQFYNTIEGFTISGRAQNCQGIKMTECARWIIRDVLINLTNYEGLYLYQSYLGDISGLFLRGCGDDTHDSMVLDGPDAPNGCHAITVMGGEMAGGHRNGVYLKYGASVSFFGTTIEGFTGGAGIVNNGGYSLTVHGCYFELNLEDIVETGNTFSSNYTGNYFAVLTSGGRGHLGLYDAQGVKIEGNYFETGASVKVFDSTVSGTDGTMTSGSIKNNLSQTYPVAISASLLGRTVNGNIIETFDGGFFNLSYGQQYFKSNMKFAELVTFEKAVTFGVALTLAQGFEPQGGIQNISNTGLSFTSSFATPEGAITAAPGSLHTNGDGGHLYMKKTGAGNTGWVEITIP